MEEREYNFILDPNRGKKWFIFYTKIRPWFSVLFLPLMLINFFLVVFMPEEFDYPLLFSISGLFSIATAILQLIVFIKSFGDYFNFVRFVKIVLIIESLDGFLTSVVTSINTGDWIVGLISAVAAAALWFLYYRLNFKYFDSRLICTNPPTDQEREQYMQQKAKSTKQTAVRTSEQLLSDYGFIADNEGASAEPTSVEEQEESDCKIIEQGNADSSCRRAKFCRMCGEKLQEDSKFCSNCGTKIN